MRRKEKIVIAAEAKTLKALCYLQLLRIFAPAYDVNPDAPGVILKTELGIEDKQRSSIRECVAKIKELLTDAASVEHSSDRNGWLSQEATQYLLADLALYSNDYQGAIDAGNKVLSKSNDIYFTSEGLNSLWSKNSYSGRIFAF